MGREGNFVLGSRTACMVAAVVFCVCTSEARATILLFNEARDAATRTVVVPAGSGSALEQDYGDRVTGLTQAVPGGVFTYGNDGEGFTPNVVVEYFVGFAAVGAGLSIWEDDYGDLHNVVFGANNSEALFVRLTADPGYDVLLYGFDVAGWPNADYTIDAVRVSDETAILFSQDDVLIEGNLTGPRHTSFDFASPLAGSQLLIALDYGNLPGSQHDNIGIDNIRFGQNPPGASLPTVIPEAPTWLLLGLGMGMFALWRRRTPIPTMSR